LKSPLLLCSVALLTLISGCESNPVKPDRAQVNAIKTVVIHEQVITPAKGMYFNDQALRMGSLLGGAVGALIVSNSDPAPVKVAKMMTANNIVVEKMLRDEFIKELRQSNKFVIVDAGPADAEFQLSIVKYGLSAIPWHKELQPIVAANVELKSADGNIVWNYTRSMSNHSDREIPAFLFDDYMTNIELLRTGYLSACKIVAKDMVKNLSMQ
jgi:hypothetical protein